jgi:hypothetical protein
LGLEEGVVSPTASDIKAVKEEYLMHGFRFPL